MRQKLACRPHHSCFDLEKARKLGMEHLLKEQSEEDQVEEQLDHLEEHLKNPTEVQLNHQLGVQHERLLETANSIEGYNFVRSGVFRNTSLL